MYFIYKVEYKKATPSIEQMLAKLNETTGIEIVSEMTNNGDLSIEDFNDSNLSFNVRRLNNEIIVHTGNHFKWYLLEATIFALEELGGQSDTKVSDLARKKWEEVKTIYMVRNLINWDGIWPEEEKGYWNT